MWWVLVFAAVLLIGITKSGFGSGVGLMIVPMVAIAFGNIPGRGSEMALGLLLPLLIVGDLLAVWQYWDLFFAGPAKQYVIKLLPGTAVGVALGGVLLWFLHRQANLVGALIRIEIGIESVLLVSLHWWRIWRGSRRHLLREPLRSHLTGGFAAVELHHGACCGADYCDVFAAPFDGSAALCRDVRGLFFHPQHRQTARLLV